MELTRETCIHHQLAFISHLPNPSIRSMIAQYASLDVVVSALVNAKSVSVGCLLVRWLGIREVDNEIWLVTFMDFDLEFFDQEDVGLNRPLIRSNRRKG